MSRLTSLVLKLTTVPAMYSKDMNYFALLWTSTFFFLLGIFTFFQYWKIDCPHLEEAQIHGAVPDNLEFGLNQKLFVFPSWDYFS